MVHPKIVQRLHTAFLVEAMQSPTRTTGEAMAIAELQTRSVIERIGIGGQQSPIQSST